MSQQTQLRAAVSLMIAILVIGVLLLLRGHEWSVGVVAVSWLVFMLWAAQFRCRRCRTHHLFELGGLTAHPIWPREHCHVCGLSTSDTTSHKQQPYGGPNP
jgi:hypothetical protein